MKNSDHLVYACAGCSGAAQISYKLALAMDKQGLAEMSCLAGIASERKSFRREIRDRRVIVIDGCPLECGRLIFEKQKLPIHNHIRLHKLGIRKQEPVSDHVVHKLLENVLCSSEGRRLDGICNSEGK
jgi:uncharacterized metal-binding protein